MPEWIWTLLSRWLVTGAAAVSVGRIAMERFHRWVDYHTEASGEGRQQKRKGKGVDLTLVVAVAVGWIAIAVILTTEVVS
ncbi:MAG: hypothetical protein M3O70_25970 [Actinomycetota bacterium]|nr:hypothetical protein [Actinomycetota bacterium]